MRSASLARFANEFARLIREPCAPVDDRRCASRRSTVLTDFARRVIGPSHDCARKEYNPNIILPVPTESGATMCSEGFWGQSVVRFVFLDEGGISKHEPYLVVAGVFVHGDLELVPLERELDRLVRKHIPEEHQVGFVFHAKDIWSGTGKIFGDREKWPLNKRLRILRDLTRIPRKLDLPIVHMAMRRSEIKFDTEPKSAHDFIVSSHALVFSACTLEIETYMRMLYPSEVAQLVAEDNADARAAMKGVHALFIDPRRADPKEPIVPNNILPLRHIRGSVHFADKNESGPLQLADLCAFLIRGHLSGHPHNAPFYNRLRSMMLKWPAGERHMSPPFTVSPPYVPWKLSS